MVGSTLSQGARGGRTKTIRVRIKLIAKPRAEFDRMHHYLYLAERNPPKAQQFWKAVHAPMKEIGNHLHSGTSLTHPHFSDQQLRFVRPAKFPKYLLVSQVTDDCSFLLRILHGSQNLDTELRPE
jgi:plasmid stabilization system protein ParE